VEPSELEVVIGQIIWSHAGRTHPVSIAEVIRLCGAGGYTLSVRTVKNVVEQIARDASVRDRGTPGGTVRVLPDHGRGRPGVAVRPYRKQILTMWRTLRTLDSAERCRSCWATDAGVILMDGKVRVLVFEMTGSDQTLQEALRRGGKTINGTDSLTVAARNEAVAPVAAITPVLLRRGTAANNRCTAEEATRRAASRVARATSSSPIQDLGAMPRAV